MGEKQMKASEAKKLTQEAQERIQEAFDKSVKKEVKELLEKIRFAASTGKSSIEVNSLRPAVVEALEELGYEYNYEHGGIGGSYHEVVW